METDTPQKSFCLTDYDCIGWDLDHTMIRYRLKNLMNLVFDATLKYLISSKKIPQDFKATLNEKFGKKGLIVDIKRGNVIKLGHGKQITRAYHGFKKLSKHNVMEAYGSECKINFEGSTNTEFWSISSYFEAPVVSLYSSLIEYENSQSSQPNYIQYFMYLTHAADFNFNNFKAGYFFGEIAAHPEKYIYQQPKVTAWLQSLKKDHKKFLFLLTNSFLEFTDVLMTYSFGANWTELFDVVSVIARKPHWFTSTTAFYEVQYVKNERGVYPGPEHPLKAFNGKIERNHMYLGGNLSVFTESLLELLKDSGKEPPTVCYFGDHLFGDVQVPKTKGWGTVAIVEELEDEAHHFGLLPNDHHTIVEFKGETNSNHHPENEYWGSFFHDVSHDDFGESKEKSSSFWGHVSKTHSDYFVASLEELASHPPDAKLIPKFDPQTHVGHLESSKQEK